MTTDHLPRLLPALAVAASLSASLALAQVAPGTTGIDASGDAKSERAACEAGRTPQDRATCLREVRNANAEKRAGRLDNAGSRFGANAVRRCEALAGEDQVACEARIVGYGKLQGNIGGGGLLREVETVVVPRDLATITIQPKTASDAIVVIRQ